MGKLERSGKQTQMATPFEDFFRQVPPITRAYVGACVVTTLAVHLEFINPLTLYFNGRLLGNKHEIWRLLTPFLFFGYFGLNFIFHIYFLTRHSWELEDQFYRGRTGDYIFLFLFGALLLLLINGFMVWYGSPMMFLAPSLAFMVVYVWSRRNPSVNMSFLGLFTFSAPYLPWVILGFGLLLGQSPMHDLLGIAAGHVYYYLEDVYPRV